MFASEPNSSVMSTKARCKTIISKGRRAIQRSNCFKPLERYNYPTIMLGREQVGNVRNE